MSHEDQLNEEATFSMKVLKPFLYPSIQQVFIVWIKEQCWRYKTKDQNIVLLTLKLQLKASKLKCKRISKELAKERPVVSDRKKSMYEGPEMEKSSS